MGREMDIMQPGRSGRDCQGCQPEENDNQNPNSSKHSGTVIILEMDILFRLNCKEINCNDMKGVY